MIELWIPVTVAAAFCQNLRSALQKHLKARLSDAGATYVRFLYAFPLAALYCTAVSLGGGFELPAVNPRFLAFCFAGAMTQILFTFLLMWMFNFRNFAVGTTYSKTETVQVAVLGLLVLGDTLSAGAVLGIVISVAGVMVLSAAHGRISPRHLVTGLGEKSALMGLACGAFLGASSIFYRGASLALGDGPAVMRAAFALAVATGIQVVVMGAWLAWREPGQIGAVLRNWRLASLVGLAGVLASICWFFAFTVENAAHVRALGQIELVFTFIASHFFFKERSNLTEVAGILAVIAGIVLLLFSA
ncbi:MAG: EamA family transporter [Rhodospirillales bacterium]|jgi:drug/metabolite transporter (DMT)-like permease|nr:EamA family transporter [Rhodospirillales bacterium]